MSIDVNYSARLRPVLAPVNPPAPPSAAMFAELPHLLANGIPTVVPLIARGEVTAGSFEVHLNQNYAFTGSAPDSYQLVGGSTSFAQHGILTAAYPAMTRTIDLTGLTVLMDGADTVIQNQNAFAGLAATYLVFIDNEILSIVGSTLLSTGQYNLQVRRAAFGTVKAAHAAGADVFILRRDLMLPIQHPQFQPGNTAQFKIAMQGQGGVSDLSVATASSITLAGTAQAIPAVSALTVNGSTVNAGYEYSTAMDISWIDPEVAGDVSNACTLLEFLESGTVANSLQIPWGTTSTTYTYPTSPASFVLRATVVMDSDWNKIYGPSTSINVFASSYH